MSSLRTRLLLCALCMGMVTPAVTVFAEEVVTPEEAVASEEVVITEEVAVEEVIAEEIVEAPEEVAAEETVEEETAEEVTTEEATTADEEMIEEMVAEDPDLLDTGETTLKESLVKISPETFSLGTFLKINTTSDPKASYIDNIDTIGGTINSYKLAKRPGYWTWEDLTVLRHQSYVYALRLAFDNKYKGYRESVVGKGLEKVLGLTDHYEGTILLDEYKNYALWNVTLKDAEELRSFLTYLSDCLAAKGRRKFDALKPVLRLRLDDDVLLKNLEPEDWAHLNMLFNVIDPADLKTIKHFDDLQDNMNDTIAGLSDGTLIYPKEGCRKHVMRKLESFFKNFEVKEATTVAIAFVGASLGLWAVGKTFDFLYNEYCSSTVNKIWPTKRKVSDELKAINKTNDLLRELIAQGAATE